MAVAGLRPVSVAHPSSLLQMWRELENEPVSSRKHLKVEKILVHQKSHGSLSVTSEECLSERQDIENEENENLNKCEDGKSSTSDCSSDMGDVERGRVRHIFQELQNNGVRGQAPNKMRSLCGRQMWIDLLAKTENQHKKELQDLSDRRPVSNFSHRNRIQASLRGRFLCNRRLLEDERPLSVAVSELGLLRQMHTVSGLREGFISKMDNFGCSSSRSAESDTSPNSEIRDFINDQIQTIALQAELDIIQQQPESSKSERDNNNACVVQSDGDDARHFIRLCEINSEGQFEIDDQEQIQSSNSTSIEIIGVLQNDRAEERHESRAGQIFPDSHATDMPLNQVNGNKSSITEDTDEFGGWRESTFEGINTHMIGPSDHLYQELDDFQQNPHMEEEVSTGRFDDLSYPEDDSVYNADIRALLSRRSVSNLLHSDFRESLDLLVQSYVDRQAHSLMAWEVEETWVSGSTPTVAEQDELQNGGPYQGQSEDTPEQVPVSLAPLHLNPSQTLWDQELQDGILSRNGLQHTFGMELDILNDLRIEMSSLQERMYNMQRALEACMNMQLELQRSVRHEVSAALNGPLSSADGSDCLQKDGSMWDHVKKGSCCVCSSNSIDSLLYRCGHMCTCSKCADKLVQRRGKCPMCRAPVIEMIRAYSVQ